MTPICTRVNAESIGPLLDRIAPCMVLIGDYPEVIPWYMEYVRDRGYTKLTFEKDDEGYYSLPRAEDEDCGPVLTPNAFVDAMKEACPR